MIITCPSCSTRYPVDASSFAPSGRRVRCAKCGHSWHQGPPTDLHLKGEVQDDKAAAEAASEAAPQAAPQAAPVPQSAPVLQGPLFKKKAEPAPTAESPSGAEAPVEEASTESGEEAAERPAQLGTTGGRMRAFLHDAASMRRGRVLSAAGWVLLVAFVGSTLYSGWHFRHAIASIWPASTRLYAAVDAPINLRGFEFRDVTYERQTENGLPVLAVKGQIVNVTEERRAVPRLRVGLFDGHQRELYHWTFALAEQDLAPKASAPFLTRLSSPPVGTRDLELRFVLKGEDVAPGGASASPAASAPAASSPAVGDR